MGLVVGAGDPPAGYAKTNGKHFLQSIEPPTWVALPPQEEQRDVHRGWGGNPSAAGMKDKLSHKTCPQKDNRLTCHAQGPVSGAPLSPPPSTPGDIPVASPDRPWQSPLLVKDPKTELISDPLLIHSTSKVQ